MESVGFATLNIQPSQITHLDNVTELWNGIALTTDGERRLYIKRARPYELLSECLCAVIGSEIGLNIPKAYLVQDPLEWIGGGILIGSEDAGAPSLKQYLRQGDRAVQVAITRWGGLREAALFDEWTANPDRNLGNLLWDGADGWLLIDHARALGTWPPWHLVPPVNIETANQLMNVLSQIERDLAPLRLSKQATPFGLKCSQIDTDQVLQAARCEELRLGERARLALCFLQGRIPMLPQLMARHGRVTTDPRQPQLEL